MPSWRGSVARHAMGKSSRRRSRALAARSRSAFALPLLGLLGAALPLSWATDAWSVAAHKRPVLAHVANAVSARPTGRSLGSPTEGHLVGGAHLDESPFVRVVPSYAAG